MIVSSIVLGYHGCNRSVAEAVVGGVKDLKSSQNDYDWLGEGVYFWENSPRRALHWAQFLKDNPKVSKSKIEDPVAIGAVIELGNCLDLTDQFSLDLLAQVYPDFEEMITAAKRPMPKNQETKDGDHDLLKRYLDCAAINFFHKLRDEKGFKPYDSVRGVFFEGVPLFSGSKIREKTHIQLAVRNPDKVLGYFWPKYPNE